MTTTKSSPLETSPAAEVIASNLDLLSEILLRVPTKSVLRFKSVSKPWLSLLSSSQFTSSHTRRNPNPPISSLHFSHNDALDSVSLRGIPAFPSLSFLQQQPPLAGHFVIMHSSGGLLLLENNFFPGQQSGEGRYVVCNPATRKFRLLDHPGGGYYASGVLDFVPSTHYYKVLLLRHTAPLEMDVYSSEAACWNKVCLPEGYYKGGAVWNGAVYWLLDMDSLLRFDIGTEEVVQIPYAGGGIRILSLDKNRYFGGCGHGGGGGLFLIQTRDRFCEEFDVLEMNKGKCRWNVRFRVDLRPLVSAFPEMEGSWDKYVVMGVVGEKEDDLAC